MLYSSEDIGAIQVLRKPPRGGGGPSNAYIGLRGGGGDQPKYYMLTEGGSQANADTFYIMKIGMCECMR